MDDTQVQENADQTAPLNVNMLSEIRNMFGTMLSAFQRKPLPYMGEDPNLYLTKTEEGWYEFPIADFNGKITLSRLKEAYDEVSNAEQFEDKEKHVMYRKLYSAYLGVGFQDDAFEDTLRKASEPVSSQQTTEQAEQEAVNANKEDLAENTTIYEFAFSGEPNAADVTDNTSENPQELIFRNILRTGTWKLSPTKNKKPLVIDKQMLDTLVESFNDPAFEYVTVPETHSDLPSENRGYIRKLEIVEDSKRPGEYVLRGGFNFTNKQTKTAVLDGSIAGVSCGIVFNHKRKNDGKEYPSALHHVALTNKPWIDDLGKWDNIAASQYNAEIIVGLEDTSSHKENEMADETKVTFSQEEYDALMAENRKLKLSAQRTEVAEFLAGYKAKNLTPAVLASAEKILLAAKQTPEMVTLADDNTEEKFNLADAVKAMLDAMPTGQNLSETKDEDGKPVVAGQESPRGEVSLSEKAADVRKTLGLKEITDEDLKNLEG